MQSTLAEFSTASVIEVTPLVLNDSHADYLIENYCPSRLLEKQIEKHLEDEHNEEKELKETYEYLQQFEGFQPKPKPQTYLRVGKHGKNKRTR